MEGRATPAARTDKLIGWSTRDRILSLWVCAPPFRRRAGHIVPSPRPYAVFARWKPRKPALHLICIAGREPLGDKENVRMHRKNIS